jgi:hypothetical protein
VSEAQRRRTCSAADRHRITVKSCSTDTPNRRSVPIFDGAVTTRTTAAGAAASGANSRRCSYSRTRVDPRRAW